MRRLQWRDATRARGASAPAQLPFHFPFCSVRGERGTGWRARAGFGRRSRGITRQLRREEAGTGRGTGTGTREECGVSSGATPREREVLLPLPSFPFTSPFAASEASEGLVGVPVPLPVPGFLTCLCPSPARFSTTASAPARIPYHFPFRSARPGIAPVCLP